MSVDPQFHSEDNVTDLLHDIISKLGLRGAQHEAILRRAGNIMEQRHNQTLEALREKTAPISPLSKAFWSATFKNMGTLLNIWPNTNYRAQTQAQAQAQAEKKQESANTTGGLNIDFKQVQDDLRRATAQYIVAHRLSLAPLSEKEKNFLFPEGIPSHNYGASPSSEL
ncbi:MAG: hypothetical protein CMH27_02345 [Micavibrio sp.]|nr:hypothetical protein [Micavibrio sp.]|tara:strand:+ start:824 stop:1327 length:504 start_codon:yes stop_codon:yes gene_type:complete